MNVQTGRTSLPDMPKPPQAVAMTAPRRMPFAPALKTAARIAVMVATLGLSALAGIRATSATANTPPAERVAIR